MNMVESLEGRSSGLDEESEAVLVHLAHARRLAEPQGSALSGPALNREWLMDVREALLGT